MSHMDTHITLVNKNIETIAFYLMSIAEAKKNFPSAVLFGRESNRDSRVILYHTSL